MEELRQKFPEAIEEITTHLGEETITLKKEYILPACHYLKSQGYTFLSDLTGVDLGVDKNPRFQVVYHLYSLNTHKRLRLKINLPAENPTVESVTPTWGGYFDVMFTANNMPVPLHASHVAQVYVEVA